MKLGKFKLSKEERAIEREIEKYVPVGKEEEERFKAALARYRKNAILHIRINAHDLDSLKTKAKKFGVKYQTFIAEILHRVARQEK